MVDYLPRSAWGARASEGPVALVPSKVEGCAIHWPGMAKPIDATGDIGKRRIASALRGWQSYHMDDRGWSDIAYQVAVDQAGRAWTLRGINIRSGANGDADVNRRFGAILLIVAPGEKPTAAAVKTLREVLADFKARFSGSRNKPYGHRDVRPDPTDCPGPITYKLIQDGVLTIGAAPGDTPAPPTGDELMGAREDILAYQRACTIQIQENTRQLVSSAAAKILAAVGAADADVDALNAELDLRDAEMKAAIERIPTEPGA